MQKDFSHSIKVADMPLSTQQYNINVASKDYAQLAKILKVEGVKKFEANIELKVNRNSHILEVWGHVSSELVLKSVVSLENFSQKYDFDFSTNYSTKQASKDDEEEVDFDELDEIIDGKIDLFDIAIEQIALQLDDYPRKKGEVFEFELEFDDVEPKNNPFLALSSLKK